MIGCKKIDRKWYEGGRECLLTHIYITHDKAKQLTRPEFQFLHQHGFNHVKYWHCIDLDQETQNKKWLILVMRKGKEHLSQKKENSYIAIIFTW